RETKAHKLLRAVSRAQRSRDRGAVSVRRWRRNRLRYTKKRLNRFMDRLEETPRLSINPVLSPFASRKTKAQKTLTASRPAPPRSWRG
ncbi:unnamed protein product, partial [Ectocarpus sp. 13 AM-2016]